MSLFKDTSIASVIAVPELTYGAQWINFNTFRIVEVYAVVTPMYLVTGYAILFPAAPARAALCDRAVTGLQAALQSLPFLFQGLWVTLQVSAIVVASSLVIGVLLGTALTYGPPGPALPIRIYSDVIRGIPILVLIFFVYYGLPAIQINLDNLVAAVVALTVFKTAQVIEITRGAFQSIPHGQMEAGKAIGLVFRQRLIYVIVPQAARRFLPPWINSVVDAVKGSALVSLVGVVDLMLAIQQVIGRTYEPMPLYVLGALIYFAINYSLSLLARLLEARFAYIRE